MILNREKLSMFLACMICAASVFVSPKIDVCHDQTKTIQEISKSDSWSVSGFTKNELNLLSTFHQVTDILNVLPAFIATQTINLSSDQTRLRSSAFYGIIELIQLGLRSLIFPHHTFW
jgi:hypothetical protein